jgi:hypothetical protein
MWKKKQRLAFLAIGGLGLLAAIAPGLAATLTVPQGGGVPAAGQGAVEVQGFEVTAIDWTVADATATVTEVRFTIVRKATGAAAVNAPGATEADRNARVRVRLLSAPGVGANWVDCSVTTGAAVCDTSKVGDTMTASSLVSVDVIAFDTTE